MQVIPVPEDTEFSLSGVELDPVNNMLYAAVTTSFNGFGGRLGSVDGELLEFNPLTGQEVATIPLPDDNANYYYYYPYGFSIASDGSFWIPQPNSGNIIHLDSSYNEIASFSTDGLSCPKVRRSGPMATSTSRTTVPADVYQLNPTERRRQLLRLHRLAVRHPHQRPPREAPASGAAITTMVLSAMTTAATSISKSASTAPNQAPDRSERATSGMRTSVTTDLFKFDQYGDELTATFVPGPIGLTIWGVDNPNPPAQDTQDYYSFDLTAGPDRDGRGREPQRQLRSRSASWTAMATSWPPAWAERPTSASRSRTSSRRRPARTTSRSPATPGLQYSVAVTRGATFSSSRTTPTRPPRTSPARRRAGLPRTAQPRPLCAG